MCLGILLSVLSVASLVTGQTARTITFTNQCTGDVWLQPTSGAAGTCSSGCPGGSTCAGDGNPNCYWNNPTPNTGSFRVPKGSSSVITYPYYAGVNTAWNGNFAFCQDGTTCQQTLANCDAHGCGTTGPYALAEFNLAVTGSDFYDVSIISGVAVPVSITPEVVDSTNTVSGNPYTCGNPGSPNPDTSGLGVSSWNMAPPSSVYQWVTSPSLTSPQGCTSNTNCPSGQVCGVINQNGQLEEVCGYLSGYWSEGAICGSSIPTSLFNCAQSVTNGPYTTTISALQGCGGTSGSCYSGGADQYCCGCTNWNTLLGTQYVPSSTAQCVNMNPTWQTDILPTLEFLKKGCPNCYTFPYDDFSSTFTCTKSYGNFNIQNYTVTLCPNGVSWGGVGGGTPPPPPTTTMTSPSSGPTGTCSGANFDSGTQVCDNGHICPSGQYFCGGACYAPTSQCCSNNALSSTSSECACSGQAYDAATYICDVGTLCPKGDYACGGACYSTALYGCCDGALTAAGQGC
ncbi:Osmotin thaumatin-like protein [Dacryopinax primogenitus]|uniref:Osmotin thaumatin-like protein n=1 Tax=Dacryopinax primogenitus (strain DJM 731) TaxID=1858805 RepID=M5G9I2_DACPD|nr:Osmotin thaumatin-like protein [Dacryopinax primogenitus]EJU00463.1 Osmotin thaumatin-like protein [Dacryopinax primogenitus]